MASLRILYKITSLNNVNSYLTLYQKHFSSKGFSKEIASHIDQLKSIASESNKEYLLPEQNNLNKSKHKKKSKYIDKYSFSYNYNKQQQKQIQQKQKLSKILNEIQSDNLPISQGRIIDSPEPKTRKLPMDLEDVLSKFTDNSNQTHIPKPSIPIPKIKLDEEFEHKSNINSDGINLERISSKTKTENNYNNKTDNNKLEDEKMEKRALDLSLSQHNDDINKLTFNLDNKDEIKSYNLVEYIDSKRRELLNANREHFFIKNGNCTFSDIGVSDILCEKLRLLGFKCPSVIQAQFIKQFHALEDKRNSLIMGAETGSGKTLAFCIPIVDELIEEYISMNIIQFNNTETETDTKTIENMIINKDNLPYLKYPKCVIIEPSSELCSQIRGVIQSISRPFGLRVESWTEHNLPRPMHCLYDYLYSHYDDMDNNTIESSPEILIVTPSVFKHVFNTKFVLRLNYLIFDEVDLLLTHKSGIGHWRHTEQILKTLQKYQKDKLLSGYNSNLHRFKPCLYICCGATLANKRVEIFLGKHGKRSKSQKKTPLPEPLMKLFKKSIWVISKLQHRYSPNLTQKWIFCRDNQEKQELLLRSLHRHPAQKNRYKKEMQSFPPLRQTIIFCNNKRSVEDCMTFLKFNRIPCAIIHEHIIYEEREKILHKFYNDKKIPILICTDMMSRGYDFGTNVELVIQCDFAKTPDIHYNRTGRTARAGRKGLAINLYMSNNSDIVKELVDIYKNNERIDRLFKTKKRNKLTKRGRKKLVSMGIEPPPTVKQQKELGIKPRKKERDFRFYAVQQKVHNTKNNKQSNKVRKKKK
eukprot:342193_1